MLPYIRSIYTPSAHCSNTVMPATKYRIPKKGDTVMLDVAPASVGLHGKIQEGDLLTVKSTGISDHVGLIVEVEPKNDPGTTYRLGMDHVRPANEGTPSSDPTQ